MLTSQSVQLTLLALTGLGFAMAFVLGLQHMRRTARALAEAPAGLPHQASMGTLARSAVVLATLLGIALFVWRSLGKHTPVSDPFDAFLVLGLLLAFVLIYFRWTRHLRSLSFFLLPMIVVILLLGLLLATTHPAVNNQNYLPVWTLIHAVAIYASTLCFALGCVGGFVYLLAARQLRQKGQTTSHRWFGYPPLASIERFNQWMTYVGFPLLTIATVAGILRITETHPEQPSSDLSQTFKIGCGILSWAVYAVLLHVPLNPRLRGKRASQLLIVGFILFIGAFVAAKWK